MIKRISWFNLVIAASCAILIGGSIYYQYIANQRLAQSSIAQEGLYTDFYTPQRDRQDILNLFYRNLYWLTTNKNYSAEFMLDTKSPNEYDTRYFGKFHIKVLRTREDGNDSFVGFVGYYMKNFYEGTILFLAIHEDFRGKHYGEQLLMDAIAELKKQGASIITLLTWLHNKRSRALYERVGFVESSHDDEIIYYNYTK